MIGERWTEVRELFEAALDHEPEARRTWLARSCDDEELRREVEALLASDEDSDETVLDTNAVTRLLGSAPIPSGMVGKVVGSYRITGVVGTGGMGTVYEAVQQSPERVVALKMMRLGLDSPEARRRFEYESQVLGRLRHPGIAQVYEAGTWTEPETGRALPFFAMELVEQAQPLDRYVAESRLDLPEVLDLFVAVCEAVHHGHQRGFIHRDLKPANVLVDRNRRPKIIDFGVARTTEASLEERTLQTQQGQVIGTLQYMSPEQLDPSDEGIDITSDVYSLGVLLFELLTGRPPFDLSTKTVHAAIQIVGSEDPPRPSSCPPRQDTVFGDRHLPPDLDWIVLRAMDRDPPRRYASASELAADIRRHLADEPVLAGPPSTMYRVRKFLRRHRVGMTAGLAVLVAVIGGTVWSTLESMRANRAERVALDEAARAKREAATLAEVNAFFADLFRSARPDEMGAEVRVLDVLAKASGRIDELYRNRPRMNAEIRNVIGVTLISLSSWDKAAEQLTAAEDVARKIVGDDDPLTLAIWNNLGRVRKEQGQFEEARKHLERSLAGRIRHYGETHVETATTLQNLGALHFSLAQYDRAETYLQRALAIFTATGTGETGVAFTAKSSLGLVLAHLNRLEEAESLLRSCSDAIKERSGEDSSAWIGVQSNLAFVLRQHGKQKEAREIWEHILPHRVRRHGETHKLTLDVMNNIAAALREEGKLVEATRFLRRIVDARVGKGSSQTLNGLIARFNLAVVLEQQDELDSSLSLFESLLEDAMKRVPARHWLLGSFRKGYGVCLTKLERFPAAEKALLQGLEAIERAFGPSNVRTRRTLQSLVDLYERWQKPSEAATYRRRLEAAPAKKK